MKVNICGIPYKIKYKRVIQEEEPGIGEGLIIYSKQEIQIREGLAKEIEKETLTHEIIHGILTHMGRQSLSNDEEFVQGLANAIYQTFNIKGVK